MLGIAFRSRIAASRALRGRRVPEEGHRVASSAGYAFDIFVVIVIVRQGGCRKNAAQVAIVSPSPTSPPQMRRSGIRPGVDADSSRVEKESRGLSVRR